MKKVLTAIALLMGMCAVVFMLFGDNIAHFIVNNTRKKPAEPIVTVSPPTETPDSQEDETEFVLEPEPTPFLPTTTSFDVNLYISSTEDGSLCVVDDNGDFVDGFIVDMNGDIRSDSGELIITASNVEEYQALRRIHFGQDLYALTAEAYTMNAGEEAVPTQAYSNCVLDLYCYPTNITKGVIRIYGDSPAVVEIRPNGNAKYYSQAKNDADVAEKNDGEVVIKVTDPAQPAKIFVRVLTSQAENVVITAVSADGEAETSCRLSVQLTEIERKQAVARATAGTTTGNYSGGGGGTSATPVPTEAPHVPGTEFVNASGNPQNHLHTYTKQIIDPTESSVGYTIYKCSKCGYTYYDNYVSKLAPKTEAPEEVGLHVHDYVVVDSAEGDAPGSTRYACTICGDSYTVS